MTKYKLLKDLPNAAAGKIYEGTHNFVDVIDKRGETYRYHKEYLENFDSWFEEIKEPINSVHWKPKREEWYYYITGHGDIDHCSWQDYSIDVDRYNLGNVYRTEAECQKAVERQKAITTKTQN